jgi:hypothetical protein
MLRGLLVDPFAAALAEDGRTTTSQISETVE